MIEKFEIEEANKQFNLDYSKWVKQLDDYFDKLSLNENNDIVNKNSSKTKKQGKS